MPILLRQQVSYSDLGTFLVSQYPYSWKVAWSPLVDGFHIPLLGQRKTWIVPSLVLASVVLFWLASTQDRLVTEIAAGESTAMVWIVLAWFAVMFLGATIRIALDSWSLDLLSPPNVHWASPIATIGETLASFVSVNVFLGATSLYSQKDGTGKDEPASTRLFFQAAALAFFITAAALLAGKREKKTAPESRTVKGAYSIIWDILRLRHVWVLMLVHMVSMIGFITNDTVTVLQLVKNNFDDFSLAGLATATLPFATTGGFMVARALKNRHPLDVWRSMFPWRLGLALVSQITVLFISKYPDSQLRWLVVFLPFCLSRFFEAAMWVAFVAFHAQVSDPRYGGIYMSLLATTLNIRYDTLQFIFMKIIGAIDGHEDPTMPSPLIDGYQIVNATAVVLSIPIFWYFLKPATLALQVLPVAMWRIKIIDCADSAEYEMVGTIDHTRAAT